MYARPHIAASQIEHLGDVCHRAAQRSEALRKPRCPELLFDAAAGHARRVHLLIARSRAWGFLVPEEVSASVGEPREERFYAPVDTMARPQATESLRYELRGPTGEPPPFKELLRPRTSTPDIGDPGYGVTARQLGDNLQGTLRRWLSFCEDRRSFVELSGTLLEHRPATVETRLTLWLTALRPYLAL